MTTILYTDFVKYSTEVLGDDARQNWQNILNGDVVHLPNVRLGGNFFQLSKTANVQNLYWIHTEPILDKYICLFAAHLTLS